MNDADLHRPARRPHARLGLGALGFRAWAVALVLIGCRADPGDPDYSGQEDFEVAESLVPDPLPGPDPWVEGESRLSLGAFYEGGASDVIPIDNQDTNYFIFVTEGAEALTYSQVTDRERVEGVQSDRLIHNGLGWWGGGIVWNTPRDLSGWSVLHVSVQTDADAYADIDLSVGSTDAEVALPLADYGWLNDGEWHHLAIPLADFAEDGVDLRTIVLPFALVGESEPTGAALRIDNLYLTSEP